MTQFKFAPLHIMMDNSYQFGDVIATITKDQRKHEHSGKVWTTKQTLFHIMRGDIKQEYLGVLAGNRGSN